MRFPLLFSLIFFGCSGPDKPPVETPANLNTNEKTPAAPETSAPKAKVVKTSLQEVGLDESALDKSVDPCQDFYQFSCGSWEKNTEIPADKSMSMRSFIDISDRNELYLKEILEEAMNAENEDGIELLKLGGFYSACMNESAIEKSGTKALSGLLKKVSRVRNLKSLTDAITELHRYRVWVAFDIEPIQDFKDATQMIAGLDQNGLGLPDRDYYLKDDEASKRTRTDYQSYVEKILTLGNFSKRKSKKAALDIIKLETELSKISKTRVERRNPEGIYNRIDREGIEKTAPNFPWKDYFTSLGQPDIEAITITSIPYFEGLSKLLKSTKPSVWKQYLTFHLYHAYANQMPKRFVEARFVLQSSLTGQKENQERWKRCVAVTDGALGELLAKPFVDSQFSDESKRAAEEMVLAISKAFGANLDSLTWMDTATKTRAKEKLSTMAYLIGFPDKWKSYEYTVDPKNHLQNILSSSAFSLQTDLEKIGKPVDRYEWQMTPPTVNAYYTPLLNQMVFPAGILQPPFYNVDSGTAVNLGAMGVVVGHELTHGFDDQGAQFDKDGNLKNWWEPEVGAKFKERTQCIVNQYANYESLPGLPLNGELTQGENIADLGGVKLAFKAYRDLRAKSQETYVADGFTEDQQFFLGFGQAWCAKTREQFSRMLVQVDSHSPPKWRVNGSLANTPEFAKAFGCKANTPMNPAKSCMVW